jgi:hypothetical protein
VGRLPFVKGDREGFLALSTVGEPRTGSGGKKKGYESGTLFTELSRDMVYRLRYRQEVKAYALEGDMSHGTASSNGRRLA